MCGNELPGHLHVPAGLIDKGQVEGDLPPQVHLVIRHSLQVVAGRHAERQQLVYCWRLWTLCSLFVRLFSVYSRTNTCTVVFLPYLSLHHCCKCYWPLSPFKGKNYIKKKRLLLHWCAPKLNVDWLTRQRCGSSDYQLPAGTEHGVGAGIAASISLVILFKGLSRLSSSHPLKACMTNSLEDTVCQWTHLQLLRGQFQGLLVVVHGQVSEAELMHRSAQVVDALLTLAAQLHVAPQEGETLGGGVGFF